MIMSKAKPEFDSEEPIFVWDIDEGCNFKIRIKNVAGYPNYDSSEWAGITAVADSDKEIEAILNKCHKLAEFNDPSRFKTYDALKKEFDRAMGFGEAASAPTRRAEERSKAELGDDEGDDFNLEKEVAKAAAPVRKAEPKPAAKQDDDDDLDEFKRMLENI